MRFYKILSIKNFTLFFFLITSIVLDGQDQKFFVEGNVKQLGHLDLIAHKDFTSCYIGIDAALEIDDLIKNSNVIIGNQAGNPSTKAGSGPLGQENTLLGYSTGNILKLQTGNTLMGSMSGIKDDIGSYNTFVGFESGKDAIISNSILIGHQAGMTAIEDKSFYLHNSSSSPALMFGNMGEGTLSINYSGSTNDAVHIEAPANTSPLRVRIAGQSKFRIHDNGGLSVGVDEEPILDNGMLVKDLEGSQVGRIYVDSLGNLTRTRALQWTSVPGNQFRALNWNGLDFNMDSHKVTLDKSGTVRVFAPIEIPHHVAIKKIRIVFKKDMTTGAFNIRLRRHQIDANVNSLSMWNLMNSNDISNSPTDIQTLTILESELGFVTDNEKFFWDIEIEKTSPGEPVGLEVYHIAVGYDYLIPLP